MTPPLPAGTELSYLPASSEASTVNSSLQVRQPRPRLPSEARPWLLCAPPLTPKSLADKSTCLQAWLEVRHWAWCLLSVHNERPQEREQSSWAQPPHLCLPPSWPQRFLSKHVSMSWPGLSLLKTGCRSPVSALEMRSAPCPPRPCENDGVWGWGCVAAHCIS